MTEQVDAGESDVMEQGEETAYVDEGMVTEPSTGAVFASFVRREINTAILTGSFVALALTVFAVIMGITLVGSGFSAGYVTTVIELLTPLQLLVPVVAFVLGFNAILSDRRSGELDVLQTYPVSAWQVVLGVYLGRALGMVIAIGGPLVLLFIPIATTDTPRLPMYASHTGADTPILYLRLIVLTLLFALVMLAVAVALSALVSSARTAVLGVGVGLILILFGLDLALSAGFSIGFISDSRLLSSLALSPVSAFRGLVLELALTVTEGTGPDTASPVASLIGLFVWGGGSLAVAAWALKQ